MKSWAEFYADGCEYTGGRFLAPPALVEPIRDEVQRRAPLMVTPPRVETPRSGGACDACGEPLPVGRGGWCPLCTRARAVALTQWPAECRAWLERVPPPRRAPPVGLPIFDRGAP